MRLTMQTGLVLALLSLGFVATASASEADKLRGQAKELQKAAAELAEQGNKDKAEQLAKKAEAILEEAERIEAEGKGREGKDHADKFHKPGNLKQALQELLTKAKDLEAAGAKEELHRVREQIAVIQQKLESDRPNEFKHFKNLPPELQEQAKKLEHAMRRLQHLRVAAENLKAAEMHDMAAALSKNIEGMEQELREAKERLAEEAKRAHATHTKDLPSSIEKELRAEIEKLRAEIKELRQQKQE